MTPSTVDTPERLLRRLEWRVLRRLDGQLQGDYRTLMRGAGIDVTDLREYEPGDDVRHIDWAVTARTDVAHVRTYLEDRELTTWLLLDRSPSMGFGPTERPKETVLVEVATSIAQLLTRGGNRIGAILFSNDVERTIPPRGGRNQVLRLTHHLLQPAAPSTGTTNLARLLHAGASAARRRSLIFVISDFISEPGWEAIMSQLTERHEVIAIRLVDRRELELPDAGLIVVEDVETGELLSVDTSDPEFRRRFHEVGAAREAELHETARQAGTPLYDVSTEDDLVRALVRIVTQPQAQATLMSFVWPEMLVLLAAVPVAVAAYFALVRRRAARATALAAQGFAPNAASRRQRRVRHVPAVLFLVALGVLVVALARPTISVGLAHREGTVILAFDVSNSMLATDLKPTRMDAAKTAAKAFVDKQPSTIKVGIVAFNNGALITQQPTDDKAQADAAIDRLTPSGATALGQGIFASLSAIAGKPLSLPANASADDIANIDIGYYGSSAIVLLSDGENTAGPDPDAVAQLASTAGVHIYPIGIGSGQGTVLQIGGFSVATALDEQALTQIATTTSGQYYNAQDAATLAQIYKHIDLRSVTDPKRTEVTALFAGISTLLLLIGGVMSMMWFGRLV